MLPPLRVGRSADAIRLMLYSCLGVVGASLSVGSAPAWGEPTGPVFAPPAALHANAESDSGHDFHPQIATDEQGTWLAVWQSNDAMGSFGTDSDVFVARSTDLGATWTPPAPLNTDASIDAAPARVSPSIAFLARARIYAVSLDNW